MKNTGVILMVGLTAVIVAAIGAANYWAMAKNIVPEEVDAAQPVVEETAITADVEAIQAAFAARETLLLSQIADLEEEFAERQDAYESRAQELSGLLAGGEKQLVQLEAQESALQEQIDQLLVAQSERAVAVEDQRRQAYYQYQINIEQLQAQRDAAYAKLAEARTRLGE